MEINIVTLYAMKESRTIADIPENSISSPDKVAQLLIKYIGSSDRENFVVVMLDTKNKINAVHTVSIGSLNASIVHPREVFKAAILHNSSSIIIGHNHPSSDLSPSQEDIEVTKRLVDASNIIGIKILDHLIVSDNSFLSFKEKGLI